MLQCAKQSHCIHVCFLLPNQTLMKAATSFTYFAILFIFVFLHMRVLPSPACLKVGMPSFCRSVLLLSCSHFSSLSDSPELKAPLCACGLFTRNTDSPSEVWLSRTGRGGTGGRNMNEFTTPKPSTSTLHSQILPSSFFLSTCYSATSRHTFPPVCVCVCVSESVFVLSQRGGQRWPGAHFCGQASVYPDGSQASRGPAPPFQLHSFTQGPLQRAVAYCLVIRSIAGQKTVLGFSAFIKNDRLCVCGTCLGEEDDEEAGETDMDPKLERTLRVGNSTPTINFH